MSASPWFIVLIMKVIERKNTAKEFVYDCTCPRCESRLQAEASDLRSERRGVGRYQYDRFTVTCPVCQRIIDVPSGSVPECVQNAARVRSEHCGKATKRPRPV
jgi:ssDNA-binding Zn-finger/Zn-ribbon topoisomerase 1